MLKREVLTHYSKYAHHNARCPKVQSNSRWPLLLSAAAAFFRLSIDAAPYFCDTPALIDNLQSYIPLARGGRKKRVYLPIPYPTPRLAGHGQDQGPLQGHCVYVAVVLSCRARSCSRARSYPALVVQNLCKVTGSPSMALGVVF